MRLQVKLFAAARDAVGATAVELELPAGATVGDLRAALVRRYAGLQALSAQLFIAVGNDYARDEDVLADGDDVACFPPVSGG